jgi:protein-tyrosine kinase
MTTRSSGSAAAERISRRFMDDEQRRMPAFRDELDAPSARFRAEGAPRFDVVRGGREEPPAAQEPAPSPQIQAPAPAVAPPAPAPAFAASFAPANAASFAPVAAGAESVAVEQYRRLAAALIHAQVEHGVKVVMITSSIAGEGKSLTAANLAVTLARSYQRNTLILDMDQRDPSQHHIFRADNSRGLGEALSAFEGTPVPVVQLFPGLSLLPAGRPTSDPMGRLTSQRMKRLLADAASTFDFVIVDSPPAAMIPDAGLVSPLVDAVVLVIAAGATQYDAIERAIASVGRDRILGTVLNRAEHDSLGRYGYGYAPSQR